MKLSTLWTIEYVKEDGNIVESKVTTDSEVVITRLDKETNELEIDSNGEKVKIDLDDYPKKSESVEMLIEPDIENRVESYEGEYRIFNDYYENQDFWALEWEGETKTTFENDSNEDALGDFAEAIDDLESLEEDLDNAISYGVPGVGFASVIAAICVNPPLALTIGIMTGIAATYGLTQTCLNIMNDMIPHEKKAARAFADIDPSGPAS